MLYLNNQPRVVMKNFATVFCFLFVLVIYANAQEPCDSIVKVGTNGDTEVMYVYPSLSITKSVLKTTQAGQKPNRQMSPTHRSTPGTRTLSDYAVGSIPVNASVSPTGARTYSIPITTASGWKLVPQISLEYNSQSGNGVAGFGWHLSGLSEITVRNKSIYYDGQIKAGVYDLPLADYCLDGMPFVHSSDGLHSCSRKTVRGHVQMLWYTNNSDQAVRFKTYYPNGTMATFGMADNHQPRIIYPISRLEDLEGNVITYSYYEWDNAYYIHSIEYGEDASILFSYSDRADTSAFLYAMRGQTTDIHRKKLSSIVCMDGNVEICRYTLNYDEADGVSLLRSIECSSGESSLPPVSFSYGIDGNPGATNTFALDCVGFLSDYFQKGEDDELIFKRGKLIPGNTADGMIMYPKLERHTKIGWKKLWYELHRSYQWGSGYQADQPLICNPLLLQSSAQTEILAEEGFQTIDPVDIDGDGTDELVKINYAGTGSGTTDFKITVYSFDRYAALSSYNFTITLNDGTSNTHFNNPAKSYFWYGNFRGDGKKMLLITSEHASKFALIDLVARGKMSESSLFSVPDNLFFVADFENDGKEDLCCATDTGMQVFSVADLTGTSFSLRTTYSGVTRTHLMSDPNFTSNGDRMILATEPFVSDLNGDGYLDLATYQTPPKIDDEYVSSSHWSFAYFDGKEFTSVEKTLYPRLEKDYIIMQDVDKDGLADILVLQGTHLFFVPNEQGQFIKQSNYSGVTVGGNADLVQCDVSAFGKYGDIIVVDGNEVRLYGFNVDHSFFRLLTSLSGSLGNVNHNSYARITEDGNAYGTDHSKEYHNQIGFMRSNAPLIVLKNSQVFSRDTCLNNINYSYYDAVFHNLGLGFCGFGKMIEDDNVQRTTSVREMDPERFGIITREETTAFDDNAPFRIIENAYDSLNAPYCKLIPRLSSSIVYDNLTGVRDSTSYTYDAWDYVTAVHKDRREASPGAVSIWEEKGYTYLHTISNNAYLLGLVQEESTVFNHTGGPGLKWKDKYVTTYGNDFRPTSRKHFVGTSGRDLLHPHVLHDATNLLSETRWTYDGHGNVATEMDAPYDVSVFIGSTFAYDSLGRYLLSETDALGRTTTYGDYNRFGFPETITDYKGHTKNLEYDAWGNLLETMFSDGGVSQKTFSWDTLGCYSARIISTGEPETILHYDALGREIRKDVKRFNGQWRYIDTKYDLKGRLWKQSLPYRDEPLAKRSIYSYDAYGRPTSETAPSGNITAWSYNRTNTTIVRDSTSTTLVTNAFGDLSRVYDPGGEMMYSLGKDGRTTEILLPDYDIYTTVAYDSLGRRSGLADPCVGEHSWSYAYTSNGGTSVSHTGPNGVVTTRADQYGRTTMIERSGDFTTYFSYDADGRLISEHSTNGTSTTYTYDNYDRIISVTDSIPDGKWLTKTYTYGAGSIPSSVSYVSQSGSITTETYSYTNGYLTAIGIPNGKTVWRLQEENAMGQPTQVVTGGVQRDYEYTNTGIPERRTIDEGSVQDESYVFNPRTGNLTERLENTYGTSEYFSYDGANRLVSIDNRQISYSVLANMESIDGVGDLIYDDSDYPFNLTTISPEHGPDISMPGQTITYTSFDRPASIEQAGVSATFTYNAAGERVKMCVTDSSSVLLTRYYLSDRYELDITPGGSIERFYLGGDAYSAPMVMVKEGEGQWEIYNIGRDYLGSITQIATYDGTLDYMYSYDPWGRLRNPDGIGIYPKGQEPALFLGRGFTGHEHLPWFGLVNMNARLYDPLVGRFLSPDPLVQLPDNTQNYNRYSYALNNPLKYVDTSGEISELVAFALFAGFSNWAINDGTFSWKGLGYFATGAVSGIAGGAAGAAVTSCLGSFGFISGAASGFAAGAAAGFIAGASNSWLSGASFKSGIRSGINQSLINGLSSGLQGGLMSGLEAWDNGGNFFTGKGTAYECFTKLPKVNVGEGMEYSTKYAKSFSDRNFGIDVKGVDNLYADGSVPNTNYIVKGDIVYKIVDKRLYQTSGTCVSNGIGKGSDVYLYKSAFVSKEELYITMGHEYLHAAFNAGEMKRNVFYDKYYRHAAIYDWSLEQAKVWNYNVHYYESHYNQYKAYMRSNPYSYTSEGFFIIPTLPR